MGINGRTFNLPFGFEVQVDFEWGIGLGVFAFDDLGAGGLLALIIGPVVLHFFARS